MLSPVLEENSWWTSVCPCAISAVAGMHGQQLWSFCLAYCQCISAPARSDVASALSPYLVVQNTDSVNCVCLTCTFSQKLQNYLKIYLQTLNRFISFVCLFFFSRKIPVLPPSSPPAPPLSPYHSSHPLLRMGKASPAK